MLPNFNFAYNYRRTRIRARVYLRIELELIFGSPQGTLINMEINGFLLVGYHEQGLQNLIRRFVYDLLFGSFEIPFLVFFFSTTQLGSL